MSKVVVIGVEGEAGLWLADLEKGTVTQLGDELSGAMASAASLRKEGATIIKGVDFALAAASAADVAISHHE
jgi:hypothetical protein